MKKGLPPSQGHMVTMGAKIVFFPYAGRKSLFPAKMGIARTMKNGSICPNNIRFHSYGLIRPFRPPGSCIWEATLTSYHPEKVCNKQCLLVWLRTYACHCQYVHAVLDFKKNVKKVFLRLSPPPHVGCARMAHRTHLDKIQKTSAKPPTHI